MGEKVSTTILSDNFNDNTLNPELWEPFIGFSPLIGTPVVTERNNRIEFFCPSGGMAGIKTVTPVNLTDGSVKARLFTKNKVTCFISILPSNDTFKGASFNSGYDIGIWQAGINKLIIYSGRDIVFTKNTLTANPETIEIKLDGDTIRFFEAGVEIYSETYKPRSKIVNIYLWAQHWGITGSGTSWADDFQVQVPAEWMLVDEPWWRGFLIWFWNSNDEERGFYFPLPPLNNPTGPFPTIQDARLAIDAFLATQPPPPPEIPVIPLAALAIAGFLFLRK